jgi:Transmembrane secretion effector
MSPFNILIQKLAHDWVRARVLAIYLLVFQGSIALGSALWGVAADHTSASGALMLSSVGIALCLVLAFAERLPEPASSLDVWNHGRKVSMFEEPEPDDGPVLVTVEYKIDPTKESEFLNAIHDYQRIRRRDVARHA